MMNQKVKKILKILKKEYPDSKCSLSFSNPFELLVATILSAQCTDERVNQVTPGLFKKFPGPREMAQAEVKEIEFLIKSVNFFRNKAKSIHQASQVLVEKFGAEVPSNLEALTTLRGVGRKTANVVLGVAFSVPGVVVDTHVGRLSRRIGLTTQLDPVEVEKDLMKIIPKEDWTQASHLMVFHGRKVCTARKAFCSICPISSECLKIGMTRSY